MRSVAYFSTAVEPLSHEDLEELAGECAKSDGNVGITGMLLHSHGHFLQAIEGPCSTVSDLLVRIASDRRHTDIRIISDRIIPRREFEGKALGFRNLDELPPGTPYLNPFSYEAFAADPDLAMLVLHFFFRSRIARRRMQAS